MGCACSRTHLSGDKSESRTKNEFTNETDLSANINKYAKITNSNDTDSSNRDNQENETSNTTNKTTTSKKPTIIKRMVTLTKSNETSSLSKSSQKLSSTSSLLKPFNILFRRSNSQLFKQSVDDTQLLNLSEPNQTQGQNEQQNAQSYIKLNLDESNRNSSSQLRPLSQTTPLSVYSIYNLPLRTQYLLNSHEDIEKSNVHFEQTNDNHSKQKLLTKKLNNEIQVYLSLPFVLKNITSINDNLLKLNLETLDKHLNEEYENNDYKDLENNNNSFACLYDYLRLYCAQHKTNNCDLNLINLNSSYCHAKKANQQIDNLLNNKYFRRALGVLILNDLFNIKKTNNFYNHQYNNFLSSFSIFVIYLSESQIEQETIDDLLCPDEIDSNDYKLLLEEKLEKSNLIDLFQKYYKYDKNLQSYRLEIDFFTHDSLLFSKDLNCLYDFFSTIENETNNVNFRLKYLKSIQQQEIEIIVNQADPQSIIWIHMTKTESYGLDRTLDFNQMRYTNILNLLQSKVLTNKYKQLMSSESSLSVNVLKDFVYNSVKSLIDMFTFELNKNQNEMVALKIDKQLSQEIFKHFNYFSYLKRMNYSNTNSYKLESILHEYLVDKFNSYKHPLIICNETKEISNDSSETSTCLNILMSKWLNKLIDNSQKTIDYNLRPSIIYRYCNHSILSSDLTTLLQSILHQLCYIIEIHESCAFDCPETLVENISKGLDNYFSRSENERKEIYIVLNCLNNLIKSNRECSLIEKFLTKLYSNLKGSNLKLIITFSNVNSSQTLIDNLDKHFSTINTKLLNKIDFNFNNINQTQFKNFDQMLQNSKFQKMASLMRYILSQARYGIKQSEIIQIVQSFDLNKHETTHKLNIIWYAIKYFTNSIDILNDNNQIMYKLSHMNSHVDTELSDMIYLFYNRSNSKLNKRTQLTTNFTNRVFHELPKCFYLSNRDNTEFKEFYLKEFIFNPKWILNKSFMCSSILYILHDINFYKSIDPNENERLTNFQNFLFKNLYNLNQDQNQLYTMTKLDSNLESMFTNLDFINKSNNLTVFPQLFKLKRDVYDKNTLIHLNHLNKELNYFSKILYLSRGYFLTLSEQPYNEIKIWKISLINFFEHKLDLIRTIKFNKTPKDIRLINKHTAVVLIERNLHLIDLNKCVHMFDLNSTMNPNLALFELHDSNHVVLLARNRLSVILMKVPSNTSEQETENEKSPLLNTSGNSDNMFLFKVGEDRYLNSLLVSKNGKIMVCGDEVQKPFPLLVWNLNQRKLVYDLRQAKHEFMTSISSISSSGKYVVSACQEEGELKNCLIVYDLTTGQLSKKLQAKENFVSVEISEETNVIIACLENSQIFVYNLEDGSKKFTINSNRFPVNKIKLLDSNENYKNFFLTYDTNGFDLTIRLWDLTRGDQLISSITCPSRIVSLDINTSTLYFDNIETNSNESETTDQIFITACLFGIKDLFIMKLDYFNNKDKELRVMFNKFCNDETLDGLSNLINL